MPVFAGDGDGAEQPGAHERVERERHERLLVGGGGDERFAAVHVGPGDHGERVERGDDDEDAEERQGHLGAGELAELGSDESGHGHDSMTSSLVDRWCGIGGPVQEQFLE